MSNTTRTDCERFFRRDFIKIGSAGLLGLSLPEFLRLEAQAASNPQVNKSAKAKSIIMVWLAGGPATIDIWDLKPDAPEGIRGEYKPAPTNVTGIQISEHMPMMAKVMDKCAILRSTYHGIAAHELGTVYMTTGNRPSLALKYPSLGSLMARTLPETLGVPSYMTFNQLRNGNAEGGGYLGTAYNPFEVEGSGGRDGSRGNMRVRGIQLPNGISLEDLENRDKIISTFENSFKAIDKTDLGAGLDRFHQQALEILRSDKTKKAFDLASEPEQTRTRYGDDALGQAGLAARRLVEAGARFVTIGTGGWDTHQNNFISLKGKQLPPIDRVVSALVNDLSERGMLESTIIYVAGEFGRTPKVNTRAGRDHWGRSMSVLVAGGGLRGGYVHGATDAEGMAPAKDPVTPDDICATMFHQLGLDSHAELQTSTGRPIALFREGRVIDKLLG